MSQKFILQAEGLPESLSVYALESRDPQDVFDGMLDQHGLEARNVTSFFQVGNDFRRDEIVEGVCIPEWGVAPGVELIHIVRDMSLETSCENETSPEEEPVFP